MAALNFRALRIVLRSHLIRNTIWLAVNTGLSRVLALGSLVLLSRILDSGEYGVYTFYIAVLTMLTGIFDLEIYQAGVRELRNSKDASEQAAIARSITLVSLVTSIGAVVVLVAILATSALPKVDLGLQALPLMAMAFYIIAFHMQRGLLAAFQALGRFGAYSWTQILFSGAFLVAVLVAMLRPALLDNFTEALIFKGVASLIAVVFMTVLLVRITSLGRIGFATLRLHTFSLIRLSLFPLVTSWFMLVYSNADRLMLSWLRDDPAEVGYYYNGILVATIVTHFTAAIFRVVYPSIASMYASGDRAGIERITATYNSLVFLVIIPVCITLYMLSEPLIVGLFGDDFRPSIIVFSVWILLVPLFVSLGPRLQLLYVAYLQKHSTYGLAIGATANIAFNMWLIPEYGVLGAVIGTGLAWILNILYVTWIIRRQVMSTRYFTPLTLSFLGICGALVVFKALFLPTYVAVALSLLTLVIGGWLSSRSLIRDRLTIDPHN